ncbi:zinc-binding alcohol dehydrogenase family protein [Larsenimonas suaedae]|uniref:Zinc-type alcohol dehydrogenase-like protein n=1 Tax=Larsenimonas suaedae TaxID=1851019 RepID=A0ABU1GXH0_9GAMM|nr:zinc-binding alcohol dehydrogenase family protein [Larsenimonas suaedae]MCM2971489.1 zinc-binding alcohol dehydrogenase family protein [Larsenimonas suaedae]MDR5896745.1 zinc-binding alcohol dehydrogenase family protein [Larsenimonas suaedae]
MKALTTSGAEHVDAGAFARSTLDTPSCAVGEVLVRIEAVSVNPVDTKVRAGHLTPIDAPIVLGWDACGVIEAVGDGIDHFSVGERVYYAGDVTKPGCNSELQCVDARLVAKAPTRLDPVEIAALPLTSLTAWEGLFDKLALEEGANSHAGKRILVINGAGGVGSMVIQLAKALTGLEVIATASRTMSRQWCESLGADRVLDHHMLDSELDRAGIETVDYVFCCHDLTVHWDTIVERIAPFGQILAIVEAHDPPNITALQTKSATLHWEFMFTRSMYSAEPERQGQLLTRLAALLDAGTVRTTLGEIMGPLTPENLARTHKRLEEGHTIGKLVLTKLP